jgi:hypothetical protein
MELHLFHQLAAAAAKSRTSFCHTPILSAEEGYGRHTSILSAEDDSRRQHRPSGCCRWLSLYEFLGVMSVYYRKSKKVNRYVLSRLMDKKRMVSLSLSLFLTTSRVHTLPE